MDVQVLGIVDCDYISTLVLVTAARFPKVRAKSWDKLINTRDAYSWKERISVVECCGFESRPEPKYCDLYYVQIILFAYVLRIKIKI